MKGRWKAVELDPSLFSEEGLGGLVCFEELTNYRLVDTKKAIAKAEKELQKKEKNKKKAKKRKAEDETGEGVVVEDTEKEESAEPAKKKSKKKKKNKKLSADESTQPDNIPAEVIQEDTATVEQEEAEETVEKDAAGSSGPDIHPLKAKKIIKRKKKKQGQQTQKEEEPELESNDDSPPELQAVEDNKPAQDKVTKPPKAKAKNWTDAAHSGCQEKKTDVSAWKALFVPSPVLKALSSLGFGSPTPIQALTLPSAIRDRMDILGAAETGKIKHLCGFVFVSLNIKLM